MRILTMGVLIVSIGTVAALPFRRYRAIQNELPPTAATGPTQLTVNSLALDPIIQSSAPAADAAIEALPSVDQWPRQPQAERKIRMPLTYDDLAVPLKLPPRFNERFSATGAAQHGPSATRVDAPSDPRMAPLTIADTSKSELRQPNTAASVLVSDDRDTEAGVNDAVSRLISSPMVEALPKPTANTATAKRHWIRQP